jgi:hypothetical protein
VVTIAEDVNDFFLDYHTKAVSSDNGSTPAPVFEEFIEQKNPNDDNTYIVVLKPGGTASGDLLVAGIATDKNNTFSDPGGWNLVAKASYSSSVAFGVWWKIAGGSEPPSYTFSFAENRHAYGFIMRFTEHDPANPINAFNSATQNHSTSPTSPAVTSTVDNALILRLGGFDHTDITVDSPGLSGHTAITMDRSDTGTKAVSAGAGYAAQPSAGDSGTSNFTLTNSEESATVTIAIAPDPWGGDPGSDKYYNTYVDFRLQVGDDSRSRVNTAVQILNAPEVPAP